MHVRLQARRAGGDLDMRLTVLLVTAKVTERPLVNAAVRDSVS